MCRQLQHAPPVTQAASHAVKVSSKPHVKPARPQIPFLSQSHAPAQAQLLPPAKPSLQSEPPSTAASATSQVHQLQDLGFVEVDLDSPDPALSRTRPGQASQAAKQDPLPIPFMQDAGHSQSSTPTSQMDDHSQLSPWPHADSSHVNPPAVTNSPPASPLFQRTAPASPGGAADDDNSYSSPAKPLHTDAFAPSDHSQAQTGLSAFAQGPFGMPASGYGASSTHSGPPSIASSAPPSPGAVPNGLPPSRRSSFLPRGMSSHLHKALRATAAAASKASAAIAPPPGSAQAAAAQAWQAETDATSQPVVSISGQDNQQPDNLTDQSYADSSPGGPSAAGAAEQQGKNAPWWQKQLRNLQQNLQSPRSEDGSLSEPDAASPVVNGTASSHQAFLTASTNDNDTHTMHENGPSNGHVNHQVPAASLYDEASLWQQQPANSAHLEGLAQPAHQYVTGAEVHASLPLLLRTTSSACAPVHCSSVNQATCRLRHLQCKVAILSCKLVPGSMCVL